MRIHRNYLNIGSFSLRLTLILTLTTNQGSDQMTLTYISLLPLHIAFLKLSNPSLEVRSVFLDLSKIFDRVWHDGLLYKLKSNGIDGNLFKLIEWFLNSRCQWVVLSGQSSAWKSVTVGVPRGSVLARPIVFSHLHY